MEILNDEETEKSGQFCRCYWGFCFFLFFIQLAVREKVAESLTGCLGSGEDPSAAAGMCSDSLPGERWLPTKRWNDAHVDIVVKATSKWSPDQAAAGCATVSPSLHEEMPFNKGCLFFPFPHEKALLGLSHLMLRHLTNQWVCAGNYMQNPKCAKTAFCLTLWWWRQGSLQLLGPSVYK